MKKMPNKKIKQSYHKWLGDDNIILFKRLMDVSNSLQDIGSQLVRSLDLTPAQLLQVHKKVLGSLLYELKELDKIHHEIVNRGGCIVEIKRYKK